MLAGKPKNDEAPETQAEAALLQLRADIISGIRSPSERLRIEKLREIYGYGPTPIREALQRLSAEGLVIAQGNRGFLVASLDPLECADINIARIEIEKAVLRLAIPKGDDAWEGRVVAAAWQMRKADVALKEGAIDLLDWELANRNFHLSVASACSSMRLLEVRRILNDQYARFRLSSVAYDSKGRNLAAEHAEIAEAALARDVELSCLLIERHYRTTEEALAARSARGNVKFKPD